jgi:thimet oligopeptidase
MIGHWNADANNHFSATAFVHEFGHVLHNLLTQAHFPSQAGAGVLEEFRETPSQVPENWMWRKEGIKRFSDPKAPISDELAEAIEQSRKFERGATYWTRQLFYGKVYMAMRYMKVDGVELDLNPEESDAVDPNEVWRVVYRQTTGLEPLPDTYPAAGFEQLVLGAPYYSYAWSAVFAEDMFGEFEKAEGGIFDPVVGMKYRRLILEPGGSRHPISLVNEFLGRNYRTEPFFQSMGILD